MRKMILQCSVLALSLLACTSSFAAEKTLRIGIEAAYPPFASKTDKGEIVGFDYDIGNALCAEAFRIYSKLNHIRCLATACIAKGRYFIDIHAESGHGTIIELQKYETFKEFSILHPL
mgnify:CR=1 FL=1